jgi:hypothetical protein
VVGDLVVTIVATAGIGVGVQIRWLVEMPKLVTLGFTRLRLALRAGFVILKEETRVSTARGRMNSPVTVTRYLLTTFVAMWVLCVIVHAILVVSVPLVTSIVHPAPVFVTMMCNVLHFFSSFVMVVSHFVRIWQTSLTGLCIPSTS